MGRPFQQKLGGQRVYSCSACRCHISDHDDIISKVNRLLRLPEATQRCTAGINSIGFQLAHLLSTLHLRCEKLSAQGPWPKECSVIA